jgi:hypothetical protein
MRADASGPPRGIIHPNVLPFPARNKGRKRKTQSPEVMGRCSVALLERDGDTIPANVVDIRSARIEPHVAEERLALRLALAVFSVLTAEQRRSIRHTVRMHARHDDGACGSDCRALYQILTGQETPC